MPMATLCSGDPKPMGASVGSAFMAKAAAVLLAPGVWRIPLIGDYVNGFMLRDDDGQVTLIDMGVASSGKKVIAALESIGSGASDVTRLMLTHCHPDHAGGAAYVSEKTGRPVDVHADDARVRPLRDPARPRPEALPRPAGRPVARARRTRRWSSARSSATGRWCRSRAASG